MSAIFILLAVGALIGTWNMAGTIPTVVDYGVRLLNPTIFFLTTATICAVVGMVTGSSWTTAGTLGVAFVGMSKVMGLSEAAAAGAVVCGAYFGDKNHGAETAPAGAAGGLHDQEGAAVPGDPGIGAVRGYLRLLHAVERGEGVRG